MGKRSARALVASASLLAVCHLAEVSHAHPDLWINNDNFDCAAPHPTKPYDKHRGPMPASGGDIEFRLEAKDRSKLQATFTPSAEHILQVIFEDDVQALVSVSGGTLFTASEDGLPGCADTVFAGPRVSNGAMEFAWFAPNCCDFAENKVQVFVTAAIGKTGAFVQASKTFKADDKACECTQAELSEAPERLDLSLPDGFSVALADSNAPTLPGDAPASPAAPTSSSNATTPTSTTTTSSSSSSRAGSAAAPVEAPASVPTPPLGMPSPSPADDDDEDATSSSAAVPSPQPAPKASPSPSPSPPSPSPPSPSPTVAKASQSPAPASSASNSALDREETVGTSASPEDTKAPATSVGAGSATVIAVAVLCVVAVAVILGVVVVRRRRARRQAYSDFASLEMRNFTDWQDDAGL